MLYTLTDVCIGDTMMQCSLVSWRITAKNGNRERATFLADRTQPRTQTGGQRRPVRYIFEHLLSWEEGVEQAESTNHQGEAKAGKAEQARIVWFSLAGE